MAANELLSRQRGEVSTIPGRKQIITNIGELFEALAVDWVENSGDCRTLFAGMGGQFIRLSENRWCHPEFRKSTGDISVNSGHYLLTGFIRFEANDLFRGLFKTYDSGDGAYLSASLTTTGYEFAKSGVLAFDHMAPWIRDYPFFNPDANAIEKELLISADKLLIASQPDTEKK